MSNLNIISPKTVFITCLSGGLLLASLGSAVTYQAIYDYNFKKEAPLPVMTTAGPAVNLKAIENADIKAKAQARNTAIYPFGLGTLFAVAGISGLIKNRKR
ncbi:MAG: hypothetical protein ACLRFM_01475 [Alphaproteobacteria bacterium]